MSFYTAPSPDFAETRRFWFFFFLLGVLLAVGGLVALVFSVVTSLVAVWIWGWMLIVRGGLEAGSAVWARRFSASLLHLLLGVLGMVIGVLIVGHPEPAAKILTLFLAAFLLIGGLVQALVALFVLFPGWLYSLTSGLVGFAMGLVIWLTWRAYRDEPEKIEWFIGVCIGIELLSRGFAWVGLALNLKNKRPTPSAGSSV